jgi:predicted RNase H-like HicB family nuclease
MMTEHNVDYYVAQPHRIEIFADEERTGVYAEIPALRGCLAFATTRDEALGILDDIKRYWIEIALERGWTIPEPVGAEAK